MLQVTEWGSDGAESTYFFFPEGEEINAAAAETYYGFYNIYTVLHSVSRFGDSVRDLHSAGAGANANIFLWRSYQSDELVRRARKHGGLPVAPRSLPHSAQPSGASLGWMVAALVAIYCYTMGGWQPEYQVSIPANDTLARLVGLLLWATAALGVVSCIALGGRRRDATVYLPDDGRSTPATPCPCGQGMMDGASSAPRSSGAVGESGSALGDDVDDLACVSARGAATAHGIVRRQDDPPSTLVPALKDMGAGATADAERRDEFSGGAAGGRAFPPLTRGNGQGSVPVQLDPWSADNVTPREQGTDAVAVASSVAGTREIAPGTEHGHDASAQPGEPCRTAVDQRRGRTSSEHDAPPLLSSVSSRMMAESRTGLDPDGVLADLLPIPGKMDRCTQWCPLIPFSGTVLSPLAVRPGPHSGHRPSFLTRLRTSPWSCL